MKSTDYLIKIKDINDYFCKVRCSVCGFEFEVSKELYLSERVQCKHVKRRLKKGKVFSNGIKIEKLEYRLKNGPAYYLCRCENCDMRDILTESEIINHSCK